ncbi:hypothetical protein AK812_SmicGene32317 [Symbiodinium microadriaticum]|uniref:Uncharacterized protein n=1 Tax=Symbiodinium microadriaticum TaxID=2951 RepID=A0A1Q9CUD7_SYMMI|nr:hypothetical protein AK812_SmicGene32317 [Symbiodinium microadriaticum]
MDGGVGAYVQTVAGEAVENIHTHESRSQDAVSVFATWVLFGAVRGTLGYGTLALTGGCAGRCDYCTIGSNELEGMPVVGRWSGMSGARSKPLHELAMQVIGLVLAGACVSPPAVADTVLDSVLLDAV